MPIHRHLCIQVHSGIRTSPQTIVVDGLAPPDAVSCSGFGQAAWSSTNQTVFHSPAAAACGCRNHCDSGLAHVSVLNSAVGVAVWQVAGLWFHLKCSHHILLLMLQDVAMEHVQQALPVEAVKLDLGIGVASLYLGNCSCCIDSPLLLSCIKDNLQKDS